MMNWHTYRIKHAFVGGSSSYASVSREFQCAQIYPD